MKYTVNIIEKIKLKVSYLNAQKEILVSCNYLEKNLKLVRKKEILLLTLQN
jgi:hypothetical protein